MSGLKQHAMTDANSGASQALGHDCAYGLIQVCKQVKIRPDAKYTMDVRHQAVRLNGGS